MLLNQKGKPCPAGLHLLFDNRNTDVLLFRADQPFYH